MKTSSSCLHNSMIINGFLLLGSGAPVILVPGGKVHPNTGGVFSITD